MRSTIVGILVCALLVGGMATDTVAGSCVGGAIPGSPCIDVADCPGGTCDNLGDHLQCYQIKDSQKFKGLLDVDTAQFGLEAGCKVVLKGTLFCAPADKRVVDAGGAPAVPFVGQSLTDDRICYKIKCGRLTIPDTMVTDQFGTRVIAFKKTYFLCTPARKEPPKIAFVTSQSFTGNFGGITAGDALCQNAATAAGLTGTFFAWLSDSTGTSPNSRFLHHPGPYVRTDGVLIATSYADLTDGSLLNPIDADEFGTLIPSHAAGDPADDMWTGTDELGNVDPYASGPYTCGDWTSLATVGLEGQLHLTTPKWTNHQHLTCTVARRLYCFEQ
jgi:hypothetical protein